VAMNSCLQTAYETTDTLLHQLSSDAEVADNT